MQSFLVIVPCGQAKIWDTQPALGPVAARDAYTGSPFKVNRAYAERFATRWVILSAKYGFIDPDTPIPGPYNVTFNRQTSGPVTISTLQQQITTQSLERFSTVIGLGGKAYASAIRAAFAPHTITPIFPFAGLRLGFALQAVKHATTSGDPIPPL